MEKIMYSGAKLPIVNFQTRVRNNEIEGDNPFEWKTVSSDELFGSGRNVIFSLPGAFTPTCSTYQLPEFERLMSEGAFDEFGIDNIYCVSVNDSFVMNKWAEDQRLQNVKVVPDGSGEFNRKLGMLVYKNNLGFGMRSWRYAMIVTDGVVEAFLPEPGLRDDADDDPYGESSPQNVLDVLADLKQGNAIRFGTYG
jgi:peroxiredoxin